MTHKLKDILTKEELSKVSLTFEQFLAQQYIDDEHPLDDDIADGFPNWYSLQDIEQICNYAEIWKLEILIKREEEIQAKLDKLNKGI